LLFLLFVTRFQLQNRPLRHIYGGHDDLSPMLRLPSSHMPPLIQRSIRRCRLLLVAPFPFFSYALVVQAAHAPFLGFFSTGALLAFLLLYYYPLLFALSVLHYLGFALFVIDAYHVSFFTLL